MIRITIEFEAIDEETDKIVGGERAADIAGHTAEIIRDRLVGQGFLDADTTLGDFKITLATSDDIPPGLDPRIQGLAILSRHYDATNAQYVGDQPNGFFARRDRAALAAVVEALDIAPNAIFTADEQGAVRDALVQWAEDCGSEDTETQALLQSALDKISANTDSIAQENR